MPYGLANNFGDYIEINENLKNYPELYNSILSHELQHTDKPGLNKEDFLLDIGIHKVDYWKLLLFMCKYPKSFTQLLPVYKKGDAIIYDLNMLIVWGTIFGVVGITAVVSFLI